MFDINKLIKVQDAKKDPFTVLAVVLKNKNTVECYSRQYIRNLGGYKKCGRKEARKLMNRLMQNHIVLIGDLTCRQTDDVHLVYRYSSLYRKISKFKNTQKC